MSRYDDRSRSPRRRRDEARDEVDSPRATRNDQPRRSTHHRRSRSDDSRERDKHSGKRYRSRSPRKSKDTRNRRRSQSTSPRPFERARGPLPPQDRAFKREQGSETPTVEKQKPNFAPSGKLAAASNTVQTAGQTIVLKYHEPSEARKPPAKDAWRMYVFKNDEIVDTIPLAEQSCWLFGREMAVVDISLEHPSCSKQHAVLQFRHRESRNEVGDRVSKVKLYVLDLESSNGTFVNEERIPEAKYIEVRDKDVIKFGQSRREYVVQLPKG